MQATEAHRVSAAPRVPGDNRTPHYLTVADFSAKHPAFPQSTLRCIILNAEDRVNSRGEQIPGNGMADAFVRVSTRGTGRGRVLIDEAKFFELLLAQQRQAA